MDILKHAIRWEYGVGSLSAIAGGKESHNGLTSFIAMLVTQWHLLAIVAALGIKEIYSSRSSNSYLKALLIVQFGSGILLLLRAQIQEEKLISDYVLMRFHGPALIVLAIFLGIGAESLLKMRWPKLNSRVVAGLVFSFLGILYLSNYRSVRPPKTDMLSDYMSTVKMSMPSDAVYVSYSDVECFKGFPTESGTRYPISLGILDADWYYKKELPLHEPRIKWSKSRPPTLKTIVEEATKLGLKVASTNPNYLAEFGKLEIYGVVYILTPGPKLSAKTEDSLQLSATSHAVTKANEICSVIKSWEELTDVHSTPKYLLKSIYPAFEGAAGYLQLVNKLAAAKQYKEIAEALKAGAPASTWQANCANIEAGRM